MTSRVDPARLTAMRTLVTTVDAGGLAAAARRLGLTPSAVSKQIARLEDALGARLLERTTRRLRPTAAGLELIDHVRPLYEALDEAAGAVRDRQHEIGGLVRISASRAFGRAHVMPLAAQLAREHPRLVLDVVLSANRLDFVDDGIDLAVREGTLADSSLTAVSLGSSEIVLAASPAYLAARGRPRVLDDLARHDLVAIPAANPAWDIGRVRGRDGRLLRLEPRIRVNDLFAVRDLVERGSGIAAMPGFMAREAFASGVLVRVLPRAVLGRLPLHVVYPSRRHLPARVRAVLDALRASATRGL